jgi:molybdenum cofactor biosynthesis enzyme
VIVAATAHRTPTAMALPLGLRTGPLSLRDMCKQCAPAKNIRKIRLLDQLPGIA